MHLGYAASERIPDADLEGTPFGSRVADPSRGRWYAELELWLEHEAGRTRLMRRRHVGPLMVQQAFHPEADGTAHVYILHPPAGVAGGDSLEVACHVGEGASALLTTPGATKFYRSPGRSSQARTRIDAGAGAAVEYFPQEAIVFDGANATIKTQVTLAPDAVFTGWELISLGRPASGEAFATGTLSQLVEVDRAGRPIWYERLALGEGSPLREARYAFAGNPIFGVLVHAGPMPEDLADPIRAAAQQVPAHGAFAVSQLEDILVCRYLGASMAEAKTLFLHAWQALRERTRHTPAITPRIWST